MPGDSNEIRGFIAIELPETVKKFLVDISSELKRSGGDVKWVRPEGMHLTLKFLGNVASDIVPLVEEQLRSTLAGKPCMEIHVAGLGAFPLLTKPRVIWAGLKDMSGCLAPMAAQLDVDMEALGFQRETRPFAPHLTLGRVRSNSGLRDLGDAVRKKMEVKGPQFVAERVIFFESVLKPSGATYYPICACDLESRRTD